jgi:hypothetical protein
MPGSYHAPRKISVTARTNDHGAKQAVRASVKLGGVIDETCGAVGL